jgi:hypothetical protein
MFIKILTILKGIRKKTKKIEAVTVSLLTNDARGALQEAGGTIKADWVEDVDVVSFPKGTTDELDRVNYLINYILPTGKILIFDGRRGGTLFVRGEVISRKKR